MIRAIFFDFDGTISDARRFVSKNIIKFLEKEEYIFNKNIVLSMLGARMDEIFEEIGIGKGKDFLREKFYKYVIGEIPKSKLKLCVSVKPLVDLKSKYLMLVISNSDTQFIKKQAKFLGVNKLFKEIIGAEGFKTKDKIIVDLLKKYKLKPQEVIYIGDRFSDVEYAKKVGCISVAIHNKSSWSTKKRILEEKPDFIVKDFYGLKKIVEKINNG